MSEIASTMFLKMIQTQGGISIGSSFDNDHQNIVEMQDAIDEMHHHNQVLEDNIVNDSIRPTSLRK